MDLRKTLSLRTIVGLVLLVFVMTQMTACRTNKAPSSGTKEQATQAFTPDQLDELLAPIALYPDAVLAQVLTAAKNPQEVLDAGNWLGMHQDIVKDAQKLDDASQQAGFTKATRALLHFPDVLDMMCQQMDWTKQLGQVVNSDQK